MSRVVFFVLLIPLLTGCNQGGKTAKRIPVAEIGSTVLYYDEIPAALQNGARETDSAAVIQNYVNKWAKRQLLLQKAEDNLSYEMKSDIQKQLEETRTNLLIYQYQQQMMLEKMDTVISEQEMENYYNSNSKNLILNENIVKALFIKLPLETPDLEKIKRLARSNSQEDLQQLESYCFQFAEKFDDFGEQWIPMSRLTVELKENIDNEENFLRRYTFFETSDPGSVYLISVRDYRLRFALAPYEYVKDDIRRIIWNSRRVEFLQALENGIYNDALKNKSYKIY
jgi:hypothetical protein